MEIQVYEFMQTKLFGLISAIIMLFFVAWLAFQVGKTNGRSEALLEQRTLFLFVKDNGDIVSINNKGERSVLLKSQPEEGLRP